MRNGLEQELAREAFATRRRALEAALDETTSVLVHAGSAPARNYPANRFPFRASSHFLHFVGVGIEDAVLEIRRAGSTLHVPIPSPEDALWHGPTESLEATSERLGLTVRARDDLDRALRGRTVVRAPGFVPNARPDEIATDAEASRALIETIVALRLRHDRHAIVQLRRAAAITAVAHRACMAATRPGLAASFPRAILEAVFTMHDATPAYGSIVTPHGEILHAGPTGIVLGHGDMLLCDAGAEVGSGYAADLTRTFPVNGRFTTEALEVYDVVLEAQRAAIDAARPAVRFRAIHDLATRAISEGLRALGVLRGDATERAVDGSAALFFPHGVGHLLGLDVHDMEDLGDAAGYAPGRARASEPGVRNLRLDRDLELAMAFTIEPGIYFVPAILDDPRVRSDYRDRVDFARVDRLRAVRGIRIEDDVLLAENGPEVLTRGAPKHVEDLEDLIGVGVDWDSILESRRGVESVDTSGESGLVSRAGTNR